MLIDIAMAGVGHSLMERIEAYGQQWPLKDWTPAEDPAEVVSDLVCMLQELPITEIEAEREKLGLDPAGYVPQDCTSATPVPTIDGTSRVELLARRCARAAREFAGGVGAGQLFDREEAEIMADFVRDNPDAPVLAMFNHLTLKKRYPRTIPNRADEFMLSLFHAACLAAHRFEDDQAAEEAARANKPAPAASWPGEKAMKPADPPFAATGFSPR
ncbi:hypothetical protein [Mesorhizobium sp.]|uniref:hypothetical protein n=1 Tax=Mesorhizobium sp. TaxID=1871066 RepID=UPI000FE5F3DF|nr:hypothetical protein [Mesorhizobium sp.]RWI96082.1 MAG: hypothetical protein EOR21_08625 [Mesorhizobium sp.]